MKRPEGLSDKQRTELTTYSSPKLSMTWQDRRNQASRQAPAMAPSCSMCHLPVVSENEGGLARPRPCPERHIGAGMCKTPGNRIREETMGHNRTRQRGWALRLAGSSIFALAAGWGAPGAAQTPHVTPRT